jgi:hypothetical protein
MRTVDTVLFDKTGTLTKGAHTVSAVAVADGFTDAEVLRIAGAVEADSEHPLARALTAGRPIPWAARRRDGFPVADRPGVQAVVDDASGMLRAESPAATAPSAKKSAKVGKPFIKVVTAQPAQTRQTSQASAATSPAAASATPAPPCAPGRWQRAIENSLDTLDVHGAVTVDGRQSSSDCATIRAFQSRFGIEPAHGQADATTADVAGRIVASSTPGRRSRCGAAAELTACVDLGLQTVWVMCGGDVVSGPTVIRSGFYDYATRSAPLRSTNGQRKSGRTRTRCGCHTGSGSSAGSASMRPRPTCTTRSATRTGALTCCTATPSTCSASCTWVPQCGPSVVGPAPDLATCGERSPSSVRIDRMSRGGRYKRPCC